jgi:hypothetical protein
MFKSSVLAAGALMIAPTALFAQDDDPRIAERLSDPALQQGVASSIEVMSRVMMDLNVAPMLQAIERARGGDPYHVDPDTRLGDIAGPDADRVSQGMARAVPEMMGSMAGFAEGIEAMVPAMRAMADQARRSLPYADGAQSAPPYDWQDHDPNYNDDGY